MMHEKIETICLVDDDDTFQFLTQRVIEESQLVNKVKFFPNGLEAINFLKTHNESGELPDVILLDLNMPIMDGWGFLEEYVRIKPTLEKQITLFIVTSSIDPADINKARSISAVSDFIIKPITKEKLLEMLQKSTN